MADRSRALIFLVVFGVSLGAVLAFNWHFDPYNRFGDSNDGAHLAQGPTNLVLEAMIEVAKLPPDAHQSAQVVIVGDSRANGLTESRVTSMDGHWVLNLGIGGASFEEMITFLHDQAPRLSSMRLLVIGTPLERFAAGPRANRCLEVKPIVAHPLRYLANAKMLEHSWHIWRKPAAAKSARSPRDERTAAERERDDKDVRSTWRRMYGDYDKEQANARVRALRHAIKPFTDRGIAVVFWSPPIQENIHSMLNKLDLQKERARISAEIAKFGTVIDMTERDAIAGQMLTFKDPVHANEGNLILQELHTAYPH